MPAEHELFAFDYRRYRACVVPSFLRLLRTGALDPWLAELWRMSQGLLAPVARRSFAFDHQPTTTS